MGHVVCQYTRAPLRYSLGFSGCRLQNSWTETWIMHEFLRVPAYLVYISARENPRTYLVYISALVHSCLCSNSALSLSYLRPLFVPQTGFTL